MKNKRQGKILDIIKNQDVATQEELLEHLLGYAYNVTQATISRDISELKLIKTQTKTGTYKYTVPPKEETANFSTIFEQSVKSIDFAENIIVIKCHTGMAGAACAVLDTMNHNDIVGTIAGDDTIMVVMREKASANTLCILLQQNIRK